MAYTKTIWEDLPSEDTPITSANLQKIEDALAGMLDYFYPVGTIYETTSTDLDTTTKMDNHFGGTWERYGNGRATVGYNSTGTFNSIGKEVGEETHTLTRAQMPSHNHGIKYLYPFVAGGSGIFAPATNASSPTATATGAIESDGGGGAHNNIQPSIVVYRYRRTA